MSSRTIYLPLLTLLLSLLVFMIFAGQARAFTLIENGHVRPGLVVRTVPETAGEKPPTEATLATLRDAADWLRQSLAQAAVKEMMSPRDGAVHNVVIAKAGEFPDIAREAGLTGNHLDAFAIVPQGDTLYILGNSEVAARHGVATLLHRLGFRYYNPSPTWWHIPKLQNAAIDEVITDEPALRGRRVFYNYGRALYHKDGPMDFDRWAIANRLGSAAEAMTGHSYDSIINRNKPAFEAHPEYYALNEQGQRDAKGRKFCSSNPELRDLVLADRIKWLEEMRAKNPYAYMVNMDPSDGEGTCHCDACAKIGSSTDRVFSLANHVAKGIRQKYPEAWVGLYAYASHRLPPSIDLEPNVYVQVAMAFNRTEFTYDQLIEQWGKKAGALGIREYWGIEAWDWGLPGRMRVTNVPQIRRQLTDWQKRGLDSVNAESGANWGAQTPGMFAAVQLMWDLDADVPALLDEYYANMFGSAAEPMRRLQEQFDARPELTPQALLPLYETAFAAMDQASDPAVQGRIVDMLSYLHFVRLFADFETARQQEKPPGDAYYGALEPLMNYAWRTRYRGMKHQYALARRLCNGYPMRDGRYEFFMFPWQFDARLKDKTMQQVIQEVIDRSDAKTAAALQDDLKNGTVPKHWPIWRHGESYSDEQIIALAKADLAELRTKAQPAAAPEVTVQSGDAEDNRQAN